MVNKISRINIQIQNINICMNTPIFSCKKKQIYFFLKSKQSNSNSDQGGSSSRLLRGYGFSVTPIISRKQKFLKLSCNALVPCPQQLRRVHSRSYTTGSLQFFSLYSVHQFYLKTQLQLRVQSLTRRYLSLMSLGQPMAKR